VPRPSEDEHSRSRHWTSDCMLPLPEDQAPLRHKPRPPMPTCSGRRVMNPNAQRLRTTQLPKHTQPVPVLFCFAVSGAGSSLALCRHVAWRSQFHCFDFIAQIPLFDEFIVVRVLALATLSNRPRSPCKGVFCFVHLESWSVKLYHIELPKARVPAITLVRRRTTQQFGTEPATTLSC